MSRDRPLLEVARAVLSDAEWDVYMTNIVLGYGRHAGSERLGISESAYRHRLAAAKRKLDVATKEAA